jgi:hypothetical protein
MGNVIIRKPFDLRIDSRDCVQGNPNPKLAEETTARGYDKSVLNGFVTGTSIMGVYPCCLVALVRHNVESAS